MHFLFHGSTISPHRLYCVHKHRLFKSRLRVLTHPSDLVDVLAQLRSEFLPCFALAVNHLHVLAVIFAKNLILKVLLSLVDPPLIEINCGHEVRVLVLVRVEHIYVAFGDAPMRHRSPVDVV